MDDDAILSPQVSGGSVERTFQRFDEVQRGARPPVGTPQLSSQPKVGTMGQKVRLFPFLPTFDFLSPGLYKRPVYSCVADSSLCLAARCFFVHNHMYRQRYQHRLKTMNRHTTLTDDREQILLDVGFVWDSHRAAWQYHFQCLENIALQHGTCNLPAAAMSSLRTWCKHQRRQYKSYRAGEESTMTLEKIRCLEEIGFDWNPRGL